MANNETLVAAGWHLFPVILSRFIFFILIIFFIVITIYASKAQQQSLKGIVLGENEVMLSAEMYGRIISLPYIEGNAFKIGDTLVEFSCEVQKAETRIHQAAADAARAKLDQARQLDKLGLSGGVDRALAEAAWYESVARVEVAEAITRRCKILAPFAGRVLERKVKLHETITAMTPLLRIAGDGPLKLYVIAPVTWLSWITKGARFKFISTTLKDPIGGVVTDLPAIVDSSSQMVRVEGRLEVEIGGNILPGLVGEVVFEGEAKN